MLSLFCLPWPRRRLNKDEDKFVRNLRYDRFHSFQNFAIFSLVGVIGFYSLELFGMFVKFIAQKEVKRYDDALLLAPPSVPIFEGFLPRV